MGRSATGKEKKESTVHYKQRERSDIWRYQDMTITNADFWGTTPYGLVKSLQGLGRTPCFHRQNK